MAERSGEDEEATQSEAQVAGTVKSIDPGLESEEGMPDETSHPEAEKMITPSNDSS